MHQDVEASLFCVTSVQEVVPIDRKEGRDALRELFGPTILGKLPSTGAERVRRTAIHLIGMCLENIACLIDTLLGTMSGAYSSWFTAGANSPLVMDVITYVASGLNEPALAFRAATAFKDFCDANRITLAKHINMFGSLYADLGKVPVCTIFYTA